MGCIIGWKTYSVPETKTYDQQEHKIMTSNADIKPEIMHCSTETLNYYDPWAEGWYSLGYGHNDARQTGGTWFGRGNRDDAEKLLAIRTAEIKKLSDEYYSAPWR